MTNERINRKLAAILAADVVGYSRLMAADEAGTLAALKRYREAIFDPAVTAHNGRVVKLIGDGVIAEFGSVVDAVNCALSVQRSNATTPDLSASQPVIVLRIGINLGDVIIEGDDIYGDGVNIAARLEPLAEPGGILRLLDRQRKRRQSDRRSLPGWRRHQCKEYRPAYSSLEMAPRRNGLDRHPIRRRQTGAAERRYCINRRFTVRQHVGRPGTGILLRRY